MTKFIPLLPRNPGSKLRHLRLWKPILDAHKYNIVVEPFACGLTTSLALLQQKQPTVDTIICSEIDVSLQKLYKIWNGSEHDKNQFIQRFNSWQSYPLEVVLGTLKRQYELCWHEHYNQSNNYDYDVAGLLLRYLSFNGKLSPNATSAKLNIKISNEQASKWGIFNYQFPLAPKHFECFPESNLINWDLINNKRSLVVIDPPYAGYQGNVKYRDPGFIRPVYFNHQPHSSDTYDLAVFTVEKALVHDSTVVIACNYYSDDLNFEYEMLAKANGYNVYGFDGIQPNINPKKTTKKPVYKDYYWVFCKPNDQLNDQLS